MKKEELRIGNYYHSVKFNIPVQLQIEDFYDLCADCEGAELDEETIAIKYRPIKLTKKLLLKAGFEKFWLEVGVECESDAYFCKGSVSIDNLSWKVHGINVNLQYFHQLQDFLALKGEELTIKQ